MIWVKREREYFCEGDWTGQISLMCHDKSDFRRSDKGARFSRQPISWLASRVVFLDGSDKEYLARMLPLLEQAVVERFADGG